MLIDSTDYQGDLSEELRDLEVPDEQVKVVRGDLQDLELVERTLAEYEINTVFHLAAQTSVVIANRSPISTFDSNVRGTWNMLEACRRGPPGARVDVLDERDGSPAQLSQRRTGERFSVLSTV